MAAVLAYGHYRTTGVTTDPGLKIALIQGSIDIQLDAPDNIRDITESQYRRLTADALENFPQADLIVWPETVFCHTKWNWVTGDDDAIPPAEFPNPAPQPFREWLEDWKRGSCDLMTKTAKGFGRPMIVGIGREHFGAHGIEMFNSAAFITPDGRWCEPGRLEQSYYDKTHLVPFGEYMPFVKSLPWLQSLSPLCTSDCPGERPRGFLLKNICLVPNICYETVLPHVIRGQLLELRRAGLTPQILVNVTNDGWFWGSSELEQHLACGVYRTVECRRPMVIAANTGISASIDGNGYIRPDGEGPRRKTWYTIADVRLDRRESWYLAHGDWFASGCLLATVLIGVVAVYRRFWPGHRSL
jgi:apolipoprotein N-acyltransferase